MPQTPPPFVKKTFELVSDQRTDDIACWSPSGDSFIVWHPHILQTEILPRYFKHSNLCSFVRQLNTYGFRKVVNSNSPTNSGNRSDTLEFKNKYFKRDQAHLLSQITRKKPGKRTSTQRDVSDIMATTATATGQDPLKNFSLEEIEVIASTCLGQQAAASNREELKQLMTDSSVMATAIVTLSQKQQQAEQMLRAVTQELSEAQKLISILKQERNFQLESPSSDVGQHIKTESNQQSSLLQQMNIPSPVSVNMVNKNIMLARSNPMRASDPCIRPNWNESTPTTPTSPYNEYPTFQRQMGPVSQHQRQILQQIQQAQLQTQAHQALQQLAQSPQPMPMQQQQQQQPISQPQGNSDLPLQHSPQQSPQNISGSENQLTESTTEVQSGTAAQCALSVPSRGEVAALASEKAHEQRVNAQMPQPSWNFVQPIIN